MTRRPPPIILASSSPRRRAFLGQIGLRFSVLPPRLHEKRRRNETPARFARRVAVDKALEIARNAAPRDVVIAADTVVVLGRRMLGKPGTKAEARRMLRQLSGRRHEVITGVCVLRGGKRKAFVSRTAVRFKKLTREEIDFYVRTGEPMDKAGAYGIQGTGGFLVQEIRGSYTNVVGLPVAELLQVLEDDFGLRIF